MGFWSWFLGLIGVTVSKPAEGGNAHGNGQQKPVDTDRLEHMLQLARERKDRAMAADIDRAIKLAREGKEAESRNILQAVQGQVNRLHASEPQFAEAMQQLLSLHLRQN